MDIFREISDLDEGNVQRDADDGLAELVEAVRTHGKAGTVTIEVTAEPAVRQGVIGVLLSGKVKTKKPSRKPEGMFRFIRTDGELSTVNPGQTRLPFNTVPSDVETRDIGAESAEVRSI